MADTADEQKKQDDERRRLLLALFLLLVGDTHQHLQTQVAAYLAGTVSIHTLRANLVTALLGAHAQATWLGRRLAGSVSPLGDADRRFAQVALTAQAAYLTGLLNDIGAARYPPQADGAMNAALVHRLLQWAHRLRGTANEAWGLAQPPGTLFYWDLGMVERHCAECPEREAASPYTIDTIPGWPGDMSTPCLDNCDCDVRTESDQRGFPQQWTNPE